MTGRRLSKRERRRQQILEELHVSSAVRVLDFARRHGVHVQTIRRDLEDLRQEGRINRTYGGAVLASAGIEPSLAERDRTLTSERTRIGQLAVSLLNPGEVIMVDVGSTTAHFVRCLAAAGLEARLVTNSWRLVAAILAAPQIAVTLCPGQFSAEQGGVAGADTIGFLRAHYADRAVLSVGGLMPDGFYEVDAEFAAVKRVMLERAECRTVLVDHSKFGRRAMTRVCGFSTVDHLVVDAVPEQPILEAVQAGGLQLHVADGSS